MDTIKKNLKKSYILTSIMVVCFIIYTVLVATVDVRPVGELGSKVGFASFNEIFYNKLGYNSSMYKLSEYAGYLAIALVAVWGVIGMMQLVKGKSLKKVDGKLYILLGFYVAMLVLYVLFEKFVINYRPFIVDVEEGLEASYPSSHTFLAICVCMSSIVMYFYYIKKAKLRRLAIIGTVILMIVVILLRFISGAHWATDIVGALFAGSMLFSAFGLAINIYTLKK